MAGPEDKVSLIMVSDPGIGQVTTAEMIEKAQ